MFRLNVSPTGDFDLYLYTPDPTSYGDPLIAAKSARDGLGMNKVIRYTPSSVNTHYLVVKAVEGEGAMTLESGLSIHVEEIPLPCWISVASISGPGSATICGL